MARRPYVLTSLQPPGVPMSQPPVPLLRGLRPRSTLKVLHYTLCILYTCTHI